MAETITLWCQDIKELELEVPELKERFNLVKFMPLSLSQGSKMVKWVFIRENNSTNYKYSHTENVVYGS